MTILLFIYLIFQSPQAEKNFSVFGYPTG